MHSLIQKTLLTSVMVTVFVPSSPVTTLNPLIPPSTSFSPTPASATFLHPHTNLCRSIVSAKSVGYPTLVSADFLQTSTVRNSSTRSNSLSSSAHRTDTGNLFSFFQEVGFDEKETQLLLDKNPTLESTSHESLRSRIGSLGSVGIDGFALCRVVAKRPEVLTSGEIGSLLCYIQNDLEGQLEPDKLEKVLSSTDPSCFAGFAAKLRLLLDHGIDSSKLVHVLNNVSISKAFCFKSLQEIERTIVYLNRFGGVELITRRPALLNFDLNSQLVPRIGFLVELSAGDEVATGAVLWKLPAILTYSVDHLQSHVEFLRSFAGLTDAEIFKIVLVYPNIVSVSKERKLHPRVDFLKQCGLGSNDIFRFLIKAPLFLSLSFRDNLSKKLGFLLKIGYENKTKELAVAMGAVTRTSCENMQKVVEIFLAYGLSCEDILAMSIKHPQILQYNHESLEKKMEYLIEEIGRDIGELLAFPAFLGYKLDDRIKHRYELKKKIIGEGMSLNKLLSVSTERFSKKNKPVLAKPDLSEDKIEGVVL